jgi:hypothetical protein
LMATLLYVAAALVQSPSVFALSKEQREAMISGINYYSTSSDCTPAQTSSDGAAVELKGSSVVMIGDSITVRAKSELEQAFQGAGANIYINASVGRSVDTPGQDPTTTGLEAVSANSERVKAADIVIVALGTNGISKSDITKMMNAVNPEKQDKPKVYWVNVFSTYEGAHREDANKLISGSTSEGYSVIDTIDKIDLEKSGDQPGLHETQGKGTQQFTDTVLQGITGGSSDTNNTASSGTSCSCSSGSARLTGSNAEEQIFNYLVANGDLKPFQAAGIMGNMQAESGFEPERLQGVFDKPVPAESLSDAQLEDKNLGWGLVQWTPPGKMIKTFNNRNKANDLAAQLDFLIDQLNGKGPIPETVAGQKLRATTNERDAASSFELDYERHAGGAQVARLDNATALLAKYGSGSGGGGGSSNLTNGGDSSCGGSGDSGTGVVVDGYAFPIWAQKQSDYGITGDSPLPCSGICHHDGSPALDLSVKYHGSGREGAEGAPVYAISDGSYTVNYNNYRKISGATCNSVTFTSSKDKFVYWYGHLKRDTSIPNNKTVKAGTKLGNVGPTECADNTLSHLHISRVPASAPVDDVGSRDNGLVPLINKLYENLPK